MSLKPSSSASSRPCVNLPLCTLSQSTNIQQSEVNLYRVRTLDGFLSGLMRDLPPDGLVRFDCHDHRYALPDPNLLHMHAVLSKIWADAGMQYASKSLKISANYTSLHQMGELLILAFAAFHIIMKLYLLESVFHLRPLSSTVRPPMSNKRKVFEFCPRL